jgi:hypothetical protein
MQPCSTPGEEPIAQRHDVGAEKTAGCNTRPEAFQNHSTTRCELSSKCRRALCSSVLSPRSALLQQRGFFVCHVSAQWPASERRGVHVAIDITAESGVRRHTAACVSRTLCFIPGRWSWDRRGVTPVTSLASDWGAVQSSKMRTQMEVDCEDAQCVDRSRRRGPWDAKPE